MELAELDVVLGREVQVVGRGLVLHHKIAGGWPAATGAYRALHDCGARAGDPAQADPREFGRLDRLEIFLPKRRPGQTPDATNRRPIARRPSCIARCTGPSPVVIDALRSTDATLAIESGKPDRPPRTFEIHKLVLTDAAFDRPVSFNARLTNPKPTGMITAAGKFGPWVADQPSASPVSGSYQFEHADWTRSRASTARWNRRAPSPARSIGSTSRALDDARLQPGHRGAP